MKLQKPLSALRQELEQNWPEAASVSSDLYISLGRLKNLMDHHANLALARYDLTNTSFEALVRLRSVPPGEALSPTEIRQDIMITSGGMTKILKNLEEKGYIGRQANEQDARSSLVLLTKQGKALVEIAMKDVLRSDERLTRQAIDDDELKDLAEKLNNIVDKIEENTTGPWFR